MIAPRSAMLQGWKEIAGYLRRDERTVKRWEKQRQLPVRRMPGNGRTNVYILVAELDQWLDRSPQDQAETLAPTPPSAQPAVHASPAPSRRWRLSAALAFTTAAALLALYTYGVHTSAAATRYVSSVPGVNDLYLRGVYFYEQHNPAALAQSRQCLQQAVAKDPTDAPAWAALASTNLMLEQFGALPQAQGFDEASAAAHRALALDPSIADAHASLAFTDFFRSRDTAATREFQTALALDPNSAITHHRFGLMLLELRRFHESLAELDTALRLQPTSTAIVASRALALGFNGHRDQAVDILQSIAAQQPQNPIVFRDLALLAQIQPHNIPLYLESSRRFQQIEHGTDPLPWMDAATDAYRSGGEPAMWQAIAAAESKGTVPTDLEAKALAQLGQSSAALDILECQAQDPYSSMDSTALDPLLLPLHHQPRFQALLSRLNLPHVQ